jgi:hypothetical protein
LIHTGNADAMNAGLVTYCTVKEDREGEPRIVSANSRPAAVEKSVVEVKGTLFFYIYVMFTSTLACVFSWHEFFRLWLFPAACGCGSRHPRNGNGSPDLKSSDFGSPICGSSPTCQPPKVKSGNPGAPATSHGFHGEGT